MEMEISQVDKSLRDCFESASNIYVDPANNECEVTVSIDDFQGEIDERLFENGVFLSMIDYCDVYPYKYVFNYTIKEKSAATTD